MINFSPINSLETTLVSAKSGVMSMKDFIVVLLGSELIVPSAKEMQDDGSGLEPLFFDKNGVAMLATFTDKSRMSQFTNVARYCLVMNAFDLLKMVPREYGVVINPGTDGGFDISPSGIKDIIKDFS